MTGYYVLKMSFLSDYIVIYKRLNQEEVML